MELFYPHSCTVCCILLRWKPAEIAGGDRFWWGCTATKLASDQVLTSHWDGNQMVSCSAVQHGFWPWFGMMILGHPNLDLSTSFQHPPKQARYCNCTNCYTSCLCFLEETHYRSFIQLPLFALSPTSIRWLFAGNRRGSASATTCDSRGKGCWPSIPSSLSTWLHTEQWRCFTVPPETRTRK